MRNANYQCIFRKTSLAVWGVNLTDALTKRCMVILKTRHSLVFSFVGEHDSDFGDWTLLIGLTWSDIRELLIVPYCPVHTVHTHTHTDSHSLFLFLTHTHTHTNHTHIHALSGRCACSVLHMHEPHARSTHPRPVTGSLPAGTEAPWR